MEMSREELDYSYSPSKFALSDPATAVDRHLAILKSATQEVRKNVKCDLGVQYIPDGQTIDFYYPSQEINDDTRVFIYIHGGYWQHVSVEESGFIAANLAPNNILTAVVEYDLAPKVNMTTIVEQCRLACVFVAKKYPKNKLVVGGHSAGGHLAAQMLSTDWSSYGLTTFPLVGSVLLGGIYDLRPIQKCYVNDPIQLTDQEVIEYSPLDPVCVEKLSHLPKGFPCLVADAEYDPPEFIRQRGLYTEALSLKGVKLSVHSIEGQDHFTMVEKFIDSEHPLTKMLINFINKEI